MPTNLHFLREALQKCTSRDDGSASSLTLNGFSTENKSIQKRTMHYLDVPVCCEQHFCMYTIMQIKYFM